MAGRRPKPTALEKAQGNPGKRKLNEREPRPAAAELRPPAFLTADAVEEWNRVAPMLARLKVLTEADRLGLGHLCMQAAHALEANGEIADRGILVEEDQFDKQGGVIGTKLKLNPAYRAQADAVKQLRQLLIEFGMTPAARSKVRLPEDKSAPGKDPVDALRERRARRKR